jgi:uncharacterized protein YjiS (DUF1127 family)
MTRSTILANPRRAIAAGRLSRLVAALGAWNDARATRRALEGLDAHLLRDIGLEQSPTDQAVRRRLLIG